MKLLTALPFAFSMFTMPVFADDIQTLAPVRAVTLYPSGATLTRVITADVPQGSHRIMFPLPREATNSGPPRIRSSFGFDLGAQEILPGYITDPEQVYTPEQLLAFERVEAARDAQRRQQDLVASGTAAVAAAQAKIAFLRSISGGSLDTVDPAALANTAAVIGEQVAAGLTELQTATEALRADQEILDDLGKQFTQAQRDFDRTSPPQGAVDIMAVSVDVGAAQTVEFTLDYLTNSAGWGVDYEMFLERDASKLSVSRKVAVQQYTGEVWSDVELVLSTANPQAQLDPIQPQPNKAVIFDQKQRRNASPTVFVEGNFGKSAMADRDPIIEEPVMLEDGGTFASVAIDGLSITYVYPERVTVRPDEGTLILALDKFELDAQVFNRASPRYDDTGFLMAKFTNVTPEPILPGTTSLYRDGRFVGRSTVGMIPAGGEETLAFGALEGLQLDYKVLNNDTGDQGIISRADTREQALEFTVENLTGQLETVETLFALPFSEQEDLRVDVNAKPRPDEVDFEQKRGIGRWVLELQPGEKKTVRLDVEMSWPQGQILNWRP
jgi:uncharacterized protein (TIGR02231 family)